MLSVCLPAYDVALGGLVRQLHHQLTAAGIPFEILAADNHPASSFQAENLALNDLPHVRVWVNPNPLGRSGNRNLLAEKATYNHLLFADGDAEVHHPDFIANYLPYLQEKSVVCGGTAYHAAPPENKEFLLRWTYGREREMVPAETRNINPSQRFSAFNFLIPKDLFLAIRQDDALKEYGHEDTLFGYELKYRFVPIKHINNPLIHGGLDTGKVFLEKTRMGVKNLHALIKQGRIDEDVTLYKWYAKTKYVGFLLSGIFKVGQETMERQLCGAQPNLRLFDLYKLSYLHSL